jgi:hypothetical protein
LDFLVAETHVQAALFQVDFDHITIFQGGNRPASCGFRTDVTDAGTARPA